MQEDSRTKIVKEFFTRPLPCPKHPQQIANLFLIPDEPKQSAFICGHCYHLLQKPQPNLKLETKPLKFVVSQIHSNCLALLADLQTCAFVQHHLNLIRQLGKQHCSGFEALFHAALNNYSQKYRDFVTGRYFQEFYATLSAIAHPASHAKHSKLALKLQQFMLGFYQYLAQQENYASLSLEEQLKGVELVKLIRSELSQKHKEFRELVGAKKEAEQEEILSVLNPEEQSCRRFKFSTKLVHPLIKVVDPNQVKMPDSADNEFTLLALIEPCITRKTSIKLRMDGIKGWVSVGVAIRKRAEQTNYRFESNTNHGTYQISYDGYCWSEESSNNEQYISWYYNEGDIITLSIDPPKRQLIFQKGDDSAGAYKMNYTVDKRDKLHFCAAVNYHEDSVTLLQ